MRMDIAVGTGVRVDVPTKGRQCVPSGDLLGHQVLSHVAAYRASEFDTNAMCVPSGDHDGTLIVPWPPYT